MVFLEVSKSLNQFDIDEMENKLKVRLPEGFKNHYLKYNGGYPEKDTYIWYNGEETTINTFFSIKYEGFGLIETIYTILVIEEKVLPEEVIPFATDDGGNFFCISTRNSDFGMVYYCNNDCYNKNNQEKCLTLLNNNFSDFLSNCK